MRVHSLRTSDTRAPLYELAPFALELTLVHPRHLPVVAVDHELAAPHRLLRRRHGGEALGPQRMHCGTPGVARWGGRSSPLRPATLRVRKQTQAAARLDLDVSAGWASPSSRGMCGGDAMLFSTGAAKPKPREHLPTSGNCMGILRLSSTVKVSTTPKPSRGLSWASTAFS
jgi:hypothetical protein